MNCILKKETKVIDIIKVCRDKIGSRLSPPLSGILSTESLISIFHLSLHPSNQD